MKRFSRSAALAVSLAIANAGAIDLGVVGPTYPIAEPDVIAEIQQILAEKKRSGELEKLQDEFKRRVEQGVRSPTPVSGLSRAVESRTYYYDPSIQAPENVVDAKGNVIVPAGTVRNPLDYFALPAQLLFFDGSDQSQCDFALQTYKQLQGKVKLVLTAGAPIDLMQKWKIPLYFDQKGTLVNKLRIQATPAIVSQEGRLLRVDERRL